MRWYVLSRARPGVRLGIYTDWIELGRVLYGYRKGEALFQGFDTEAEANRIWDRERAILERADVERDAPRDMRARRRSTDGERSAPASPTTSSQTTLTSQRAHPNDSDHRRRLINDSSQDGESSPGPAAFPRHGQRVSVDTSMSSHSASNRAMQTKDRPISIHHRKEQNTPRLVRQATHSSISGGDRTASLRVTVDTSYPSSGSSGDYLTCRTSQWAEEQSKTSTGASPRREANTAPQTRRHEVSTNSQTLPKSSAGRIRPSSLLKRPPTNRVISIPTDDSDEEAVPTAKLAVNVCRGQNRTSSSAGGAGASSTKTIKVKAAEAKISRAVQTDRQGRALQGQQIASGSRSASSRILPIQRSLTSPAVSVSSYKRDDCHKAIPRASTNPTLLLDAFSGPMHGIGDMHPTRADPRSPIRRGGTAVPVEPGR